MLKPWRSLQGKSKDRVIEPHSEFEKGRASEKMGFHTVESVENTEWSTKGTPVMEVKMEMDL